MKMRNKTSIHLTSQKLNLQNCYNFVEDNACGGIAVFVGTVRNSTKNKTVTLLDFSGYEPMAIKEMQKNGAGFAGFATWLDMSPADADMFAIPDPDSLVQLPWKKEVGWLASDLWMNGKPVKASPRVMLKDQIKQLSKKNVKMKSGVECEYFLISQDGSHIADT